MWLTIVDSLLFLDNLSLGLFGSLTFLWLSGRYDVVLSFLSRQLPFIYSMKMSAYTMSVILPVLQLDKSGGVELEIVDMDLLGWSGYFWLIGFRSWSSNPHIISIILINRVISFTFTFSRFNPKHSLLVLSISLCPQEQRNGLTFPENSSPSHVCTILSDLKLLSASRSRPAYFELISAVFSSPRLMISSISSSINILPRQLHLIH